MTEHDPLEELRAAWRDLEAPAAGEDLEQEGADPVIDWMRSAWAELDTPALPAFPRPESIRPQPRLLPYLVLAAAGWIGALSLGIRFAGDFAPLPLAVPNEVVASRPKVQVRFRSEGGVELHSGRVRLVLLDSPIAQIGSVPGETQ